MLGTLAGGIAHDFNNLLGLILLNLEGVSCLIEDPEALSFLQDSTDAAQRAAKITRKLLAFSRRQEPERRPVDFDETVQDIMRLLKRILGCEVEIRVESGLTGGLVFADPGQIEQIVMNLAINARDAMPAGGLLTLRTARIGNQADSP